MKCPFGASRSFSAMILSQNLEIHKVFLRFFAFILTKKSSQITLADMIIVYLRDIPSKLNNVRGLPFPAPERLTWSAYCFRQYMLSLERR